jgi:hypothetical protein
MPPPVEPPVEPPVKINLDQFEVFANEEKKIEEDEAYRKFLENNPAAERVMNSKTILEKAVGHSSSISHTPRTKTELDKLKSITGIGKKEEKKDLDKRVPVQTTQYGEGEGKGKKNLYKIMNKKSRRGKRSRRSRRSRRSKRSRRSRISRRSRKSRKHRT